MSPSRPASSTKTKKAAAKAAAKKAVAQRAPATRPAEPEVIDEKGTDGVAPGPPSRAPHRIVIEGVTPVIEGGRYPIKRVVGEPVTVEASIYAEGHDHLWCVVAWQAPGGEWTTTPMVATNPGLDQWRGAFTPLVEGFHRFEVRAWIDEFGSWSSGTARKVEAGVAIDSELLEGAALLEAAATRLADADRAALLVAAAQLRDGDLTPMSDRGGEARPSATQLFHASRRPDDAATSLTYVADVERERALFSSWYELFPRSWGASPAVHGTLADVEAQLDYVVDMGFDILYLPPIHPIGHAFRKGPNNAETATPFDVGSPWAIGGPEGGHTALHPDLGTMADFDSLVAACTANGIELALDIAFQASPDHPWVTEHPEWFKHRPDGSIQYAENPPKKYQDIYPLNFESDAWFSLWEALLEVFVFWADHGVRIFRVDNPHTKPFAFWEWVIREVRNRYPESIFLAEAFTRPKVMHRLGQVGFTQSYSYFPWRVAKGDIVEYFDELSSSPSVDEFRPSCWPNTPDILAWDLMDAPREQFALRVLLAATLSPSYGVYGPSFELGDNRPAGNGKEEYLDSEKYQLRWWDRDDPDSLRGLLTDLNEVRRDNLALHTLRTLRFHGIDNDELVCFSKTTYAGPSTNHTEPHRATILVVANLDATNAQSGMTHLDLTALGVDGGRPFEVHDLLSSQRFTWYGPENYVELHPTNQPGHIFRVTQA